MKVIITNFKNRIELIKFFRNKENQFNFKLPNLTLNEINLLILNLHNKNYILAEEVSKEYANELKKLLDDIADIKLEEDIESICNLNISPSKETEEALIWFSELPEINKQKVKLLTNWFNRPAVC